MDKDILASLEGSLSRSSIFSLYRWIDHLSGDKNNYFSHLATFSTAILSTFSAMIVLECGSGNLQAIMVLAGTSSIKQRLSQVEILL